MSAAGAPASPRVRAARHARAAVAVAIPTNIPATSEPAPPIPLRPASITLVVLAAGSGTWAAIANYGSRHSVSSYADGKAVPTYTSACGHFGATFPTTPQQRENLVQIEGARTPVRQDVWQSGSDRNHFDVGVMTIPRHVHATLNAGLTATANDLGGWVLQWRHIQLEGYRATQCTVRTNDGEEVEVLAVAAYHRLYLIEVDAANGSLVGFNRFKASFHITA